MPAPITNWRSDRPLPGFLPMAQLLGLVGRSHQACLIGGTDKELRVVKVHSAVDQAITGRPCDQGQIVSACMNGHNRAVIIMMNIGLGRELFIDQFHFSSNVLPQCLVDFGIVQEFARFAQRPDGQSGAIAIGSETTEKTFSASRLTSFLARSVSPERARATIWKALSRSRAGDS